MSDMDQDEIDAFWEDAKVRAGLNPARSFAGPNVADSVPPPAWSFGAGPQEADELLGLVLAGRKTATASSAWDYEAAGEDPPTSGELSIILDGGGHPRALIRTVEVQVVPFEEVGAEHAYAEGEGDRSLEHWRAVHRRVFAAHPAGRPTDTGVEDHAFDERMPVVLERFEVLVPVALRPGSPRLFGR